MRTFAALATCCALLVTACGRIAFDARRDGGAEGSADAVADAMPDAFVAPNVAFVTRATMTGSFGGLAGADTICSTAAINGGLPGTFVALLSSSTVLASDRVAAARGWVRTDGAPVADQIGAMMDGEMFEPIDRDGNRCTSPV